MERLNALSDVSDGTDASPFRWTQRLALFQPEPWASSFAPVLAYLHLLREAPNFPHPSRAL